MSSLFEVRGQNRFKNNKDMTISVYGVRTSEKSPYKAEFLIYYDGRWIWMEAENYTPINNKHN